MDAVRFDVMTRTLASELSSRQRLVLALAAGALCSALSRIGREDTVAGAPAAARAGCRNETKACRRDNQCCSGICKKGTCRRAPSQRTCTTRMNACEVAGGGTRCGSTNGGDPCACVVTAGGASFCGDLASSECVVCIGGGDCAAITGPGSACVRAVGTCTCNDGGGTLCLPPCGRGPAAANDRTVADGGDPVPP